MRRESLWILPKIPETLRVLGSILQVQRGSLTSVWGPLRFSLPHDSPGSYSSLYPPPPGYGRLDTGSWASHVEDIF